MSEKPLLPTEKAAMLAAYAEGYADCRYRFAGQRDNKTPTPTTLHDTLVKYAARKNTLADEPMSAVMREIESIVKASGGRTAGGAGGS